jgi:hypothetical protein
MEAPGGFPFWLQGVLEREELFPHGSGLELLWLVWSQDGFVVAGAPCSVCERGSCPSRFITCWKRAAVATKPFGPKVLAMSWGCCVTHVSGSDPECLARPERLELPALCFEGSPRRPLSNCAAAGREYSLQFVASFPGFQKSLSPDRGGQGCVLLSMNEVPGPSMLCGNAQVRIVLSQTLPKILCGTRVIAARRAAAEDVDEWHSYDGAPKGTILELFSARLWQPCHRWNSPLDWAYSLCSRNSAAGRHSKFEFFFIADCRFHLLRTMRKRIK